MEIIKRFRDKFGCSAYAITKFVRGNRLLSGPEERMCSRGIHHMMQDTTHYVFNGVPFGMSSHFCSDLECFLDSVDSGAVDRFRAAHTRTAER